MPEYDAYSTTNVQAVQCKIQQKSLLATVESKLSKLSALKYSLCPPTVEPHPPVATAESSPTGDPWPAGRVWGGEERLPGNDPAAGEGGSAAEQPAGAHGAPGAPRLQLQQPGPPEERGRVGRGQRHLEAARRDGAENDTAIRSKRKTELQ